MLGKKMYQIDKRIEAARKGLIKALENGDGMKAVASRIADIAEMEGQSYAFWVIYRMMNSEGAEDAATDAMVSLLSQDSDDRWSGRTNDITRAYNDGVRRVAGNALRFNDWEY